MFRRFFDKQSPTIEFEAIRVGLASPEKILSWSHGEVTKPETINYRTFKPERDGLFCARIFGPINDYECLCGKYKRTKHRGVICDKCGVEVTLSKVRRERMGHIKLASPCSHVWFFKSLPSRIGQLLDIPLRDLEKVLYFESYIVVMPDEEIAKIGLPVKYKELLNEEQYRRLAQEFPNKIGPHVARMGAEAIRQLLTQIDLEELATELREKMKSDPSQQKRLKYAKRLKVVEAFRRSGNRPEWMILEVIPVIPPELRPLVPLDGGRFATSDLNDLYRRVINRNNRLAKLLELHAPEVIIRNEKRMLQEAVDALFDNGRRGRVIKGANSRPLKSLADSLKGKQGRFRQNLLGKRVDYSGRSVIVVGPELKLHQCGLPKQMALELFKPFIYYQLQQKDHVQTVKQAKEAVERQDPVVWDILDEVVREHPILLNRAPTLHRLGIQAFEPILVDGKAIKIHPLVCTAFNADFDGDQMAVHVPLSPEAQVEASVLMLASNNILSPASGQPIAVPTQDIVLGCYYLTKRKPGAKGEGMRFASMDDVMLALDAGYVELQTPIKLRYDGKLIDMEQQHKDQDIVNAPVYDVEGRVLDTTVGRVIFNSHLPAEMPYINGVMRKAGLQSLVRYCFLRLGHSQTIEMLDSLKELGFLYATKAGISIGIEDLVIPATKAKLVEQAEKEVLAVDEQVKDGVVTSGERYNKVIEIWSAVAEKVANEMFKAMAAREEETGEPNPLILMADSGARGSKQQIRQLAGMRGLMNKPSGEIIETPIRANFREGLNVLQYFISTHGARKGLADTALKTADSGYLTRRLVDVAQDVIVTMEDCGTVRGIWAEAITQGGEIIESLRDRIIGRVALEDVVDPIDGRVIVEANQEITEDLANEIQNAGGIERVKIRSVLTCEARRGVCVACYGRNLATGRMVEIGEAIGILAAQSIGEPGTQLTMRTFHIGGMAGSIKEQSSHETRRGGTVRYDDLYTIRNRKGEIVAMNRNGSIVIVDARGREIERYPVIYGAILKVNEGDIVEPDQKLVEWDPYTFSILSDVAGTVHFKDLIEGVTMKEEIDKATGLAYRFVIESLDEKLQPRIEIHDEHGKTIKTQHLPVRAIVMVNDFDEFRRRRREEGKEGWQNIHLQEQENVRVVPGDVICKIPRQMAKAKDIVGGLPRVVELFEARKPRDPAVMTEISGRVKLAGITRGMQKVQIHGYDGEVREYNIPRGVHLNVNDGDEVKAGDPLIDGPRNPHDILAILGVEEVQKYLVNETQEVYRQQGVQIHDKHIEVIVRQMLRWVKIKDVGDTDFLLEEQVDRFQYHDENERVIASGGRPAQGEPLLLGITKASLSTDSFISAASFQETTRVLTEAAVSGRVDYLRGLKENVIVGRLIPAGSGMRIYRDIELPPDKAAVGVDRMRPEEQEELMRDVRHTVVDDAISMGFEEVSEE
ncbi:MAG: DNA-directed RNA polymerase subunit beta' [Acidobacteriota bacterium]|nr:DNA-directed RNA polymerase subunit beta' [Blastocatellia bacterium]MDW8240186.1 DNA-directed RNA polymerase subunit beta' [Acidobacteriota bacterium]